MLRPATPPRTRPVDGICPFSSPTKGSKRRDFDDCSTAAPSPATTDLISPWGTPYQGQISPCPWSGASPFGGRDLAAKPRHLDASGIGQSDQCSPWSTPIHELYASQPGFGRLLDLHDGTPQAPSSPWSMAGVGFVPLGLGLAHSLAEDLVLPDAVEEAPSSPRASSPFSTPPVTPRFACRPQMTSPPGAPKEAPLPELLRALCTNSEKAVRDVLAKDPQAATVPFWDHDVSPPLCSAMRIGCTLPVVQALLEHGADPDMTDAKGQTALTILASRPCISSVGAKLDPWSTPPFFELPSGPLPLLPGGAPEAPAFGAALPAKQIEALLGLPSPHERAGVQRDLAVAEALVSAGANPMAPDATGCCALKLAIASNNEQLVRLWRRYTLELEPVREESPAEAGHCPTAKSLADLFLAEEVC